MKVSASETKEVTVELSDFTVRDIILQKYHEIFDLPEHVYVKDGKLMRDIEYYTSHSWWDNEVIREATEEDIAAVKVLQKLRSAL